MEDAFANGYQLIPKELIKDGTWGKMPKNVKAIFPVIASHSNYTGWSNPNQTTIGELAGLARTTVSRATSKLEKVKYLKIFRKKTSDGNIKLEYTVRYDIDGAKIKIDNNLFKNKIWSNLSYNSKSLYIVLLSLSTVDKNDFNESEYSSTNYDFKEYLKSRHFDKVEYINKKQVCDLAGFSSRFFNESYDDLIYNGLIESGHGFEGEDDIIYFGGFGC